MGGITEARRCYRPERGLAYRVYGHRKARKWIPEAKWVWEQAHGPIPQGMKVHHLNFDRTDNALSNLTLVESGEYSKLWNLHRRQWDGHLLQCPRCGRRMKPRYFRVKFGKFYGRCRICENDRKEKVNEKHQGHAAYPEGNRRHYAGNA